LVLSLISISAFGQSMFVSDELVVTLRTGPSTQNAILRNLSSGTRVDLLESSPDSGYVRVRTDDGTEGWVLTQYLTDEPIARERLANTAGELEAARARVGELEERVAALSEELSVTNGRLQDAEVANSAMTAELADIRTASSNVLTLRDQNESLRRRLNDRDQELSALVTETAALRSRAVREWFVVGAGVLFGGIVLGLVLPSLRRPKRSQW
jgi:SH3 domain protein